MSTQSIPNDAPPAGHEHWDARRKRLRFRSWHRGTREADLLIGRFADRHLGTFSDAQLDQFEALLAQSDPDIYNWVTEREAPPVALDTEVLRMLTQDTAKTGAAASQAG